MATSRGPSLDANEIATVVADVVSSLQSQGPSSHHPSQQHSHTQSSACQVRYSIAIRFRYLCILCTHCFLHSNGRPLLDVNIENVRDLRQLGFSWTKISKMLNVSRQTLYRRVEGTGLMGYTDINDQELDCIIRTYKTTHPNDGEVMVIGHLHASQVLIPRSRIRESIHRVDSAGVEQRRCSTIRQRVYEVEAPNCVWHLDGNHKLIRWKYVVHGAIDGYSRVIPFLCCSTNNMAQTVHSLFLKAVSVFGLPQRVRTDGGGEIVDVWQYMINQRDSSAVIVGSSVHNVCIERLWRDVRRSVNDTYRDVFTRLEEERILNPDNEIDIYCLHEVFPDHINQSLLKFVRSWHNHPLSTEQ